MGIDSFFREGKEAIKPILGENSDMVLMVVLPCPLLLTLSIRTVASRSKYVFRNFRKFRSF